MIEERKRELRKEFDTGDEDTIDLLWAIMDKLSELSKSYRWNISIDPGFAESIEHNCSCGRRFESAMELSDHILCSQRTYDALMKAGVSDTTCRCSPAGKKS